MRALRALAFTAIWVTASSVAAQLGALDARLERASGTVPTRFGAGLDLDGDRLLVGASATSLYAGVVYEYRRDASGAWIEVLAITPPAGEPGSFGEALDADGDRLVIGAPYHAAGTGWGRGSAYVFERDASGWTFVARLEAPDGEVDDRFGEQVALHGEWIVVGVPWDDGPAGENQGSVHTFHYEGGAWTHVDHFRGVAAEDRLGWSVAITGDRLAAGMPGHDGAIYEDIGAVELWSMSSSGTWTSAGRLLSSDPGRDDTFGVSLAMHGTHLLVGTPSVSLGGSFRGAIETFELGSGAPLFVQRIQPAAAMRFANFGTAIAVHGSVAVVTEEETDRAFVFEWDGAAWLERATLLASPGGERGLGELVVTDGVRAAIAASWATGPLGTRQGAVYVYGPRRALASPCARHDDCVAGVCEDGVCCDTPCGASTTDCRACSVAAGAAVDGACGPLVGSAAASTTCRPAAGDCDLAERCEAGSTECPADALREVGAECRAASGPCDAAERCDGTAACPADTLHPDGTACDDGRACNGTEACASGACVSSIEVDCDDDDACTADACSDAGGCTHTPIVCDDGDPCTADACAAGACVFVPNGECTADAGPTSDGGTRRDAGSIGADAGDAGASNGGMADAGGDPSESAGCGCRAAGRDDDAAGWWLAAAVALAVRRFRRSRQPD